MIPVNKSGTQKAIVLTLRADEIWVHHQAALKFAPVKGVKTNHNSDADQDDGNTHGAILNVFTMLMN